MGSKEANAKPSHAAYYQRISKESLYMIIAMWMADYESDDESPCKKVGAALVLQPRDVLHAVDCSRDGVHAVARLLLKHPDKAGGSHIYVSRKPCSFCTKLMVQSKVERVLYLPFEPEYYEGNYRWMNTGNGQSSEEEEQKFAEEEQKFADEMQHVDNLFTVSAIGQTKFVLQLENVVLQDSDVKDTPKGYEREIQEKQRELLEKYYPQRLNSQQRDSKSWLDVDVLGEHLPWKEYDKEIKNKMDTYFENAMKWMAKVLILSKKKDEFLFSSLNNTIEKQSFDPVQQKLHKSQALHLIQIARFLAERTDDPRRGVGAVIAHFDEERGVGDIMALGWNGFPFKARYGEFPRASRKDEDVPNKKYPYVIHAEQNALLLRNTKIIEDGILFVTKTPCDECTPLIKMKGIKYVVVDEEVKDPQEEVKSGELGYKLFPEVVKQGKFICYERKASIKDLKGIPATEASTQQISFPKENGTHSEN